MQPKEAAKMSHILRKSIKTRTYAQHIGHYVDCYQESQNTMVKPVFPVRSLQDIGGRVRSARKLANLSATLAAQKAGLSRNTLHRLESGDDVNLGTLMSALQVMGYTIELLPLRQPTMEEMRARFDSDQEE